MFVLLFVFCCSVLCYVLLCVVKFLLRSYVPFALSPTLSTFSTFSPPPITPLLHPLFSPFYPTLLPPFILSPSPSLLSLLPYLPSPLHPLSFTPSSFPSTLPPFLPSSYLLYPLFSPFYPTFLPSSSLTLTRFFTLSSLLQSFPSL